MSIHIQFVDSCRDIDAQLWEQCFPANLEGFFWYDTLERCGLEGQFKFCYALIKRDQKNIGIAPCFLHDVPMALVAPPAVARVLEMLATILPEVGYQRTIFIGSPCAEESWIGLVPGEKLEEVIGPLASAVRSRAKKARAPMVVFKDCPDEMRPAMEKICLEQKFFLVTSYPGTTMTLPGVGLDDYIAGLTGAHHHNLKKKLRRSKKELELVTTFVKRPDDAVLEEIFGLFMQTYEKGKTKFEKLSIDFFKTIRETGPAWFVLQRDKNSGKLVTFMLLFRLGDKLVNKFIGLEYSKGPTAYLYFRQFEAAVEFAYKQGVRNFQSGQTGYRAKLDLGHSLVPLQNYCRHANPLINALFAHLARDISWRTLDSDLNVYLAAHSEEEASASGPSASAAAAASSAVDSPAAASSSASASAVKSSSASASTTKSSAAKSSAAKSSDSKASATTNDSQ